MTTEQAFQILQAHVLGAPQEKNYFDRFDAKPAGLFDDLIPSQPPPQSAAAKPGMFDDLIPEPAHNSGNYFDRFDEPQNSLAGSAKAAASGLVQGAIGMAGQPGDVAGLIRSALPTPPPQQPVPQGAYGALINALNRARGAVELPTSTQLKGSIESQTSPLDYNPQTDVEGALQKIGMFGINAISPGSWLRKAAMTAVPALADYGAEKATEGTGLESYVGPAAAITGAVLAHRATTPKAPNVIPTATQVEAAGQAGYQNPAIDAVKFKATAIPDLADNIVDSLNRAKRNAKLVPAVHDIVEGMKDPIDGQTHTIEDLETTRRLLQEKAQNFTDKTEQGAATLAIKKIDGYLNSNPQGDVLMGNIAAANDALSTARQNVAIGKNSAAHSRQN